MLERTLTIVIMALIVGTGSLQARLARAAPDGADGLMTDELLSGRQPFAAPVDLALFASPPGSAAGRPLEGVLELQPADALSSHAAHVDELGLVERVPAIAVPPALRIRLVSSGKDLLPLEREPIVSEHPYWEWVVAPGAVWQDGADGGGSRAALPVALKQRNANCTHNGVITFSYDGANGLSDVLYQFSSETCAYLKLDLWGRAPGRLRRAELPGAAAAVAAHRHEQRSRVPVRPITELGEHGVHPQGFGAPEEVEPGDMTVFGVLAHGVHWTGGCRTRHGTYPYCDELILPSYSLAKSLVAGLGLMRLERMHPGARHAIVAHHVPGCASAGGWNAVTLQHLLDMASGRYRDPTDHVDENSNAMQPFFRAEDHADKLRIACSMFPPKEPPGKTWVYHTTDSYVLGAALQSLARTRSGERADFYDHLLVPLWRDLSLSPLAAYTQRTYDAARQPFTGFGLLFNRNDVVRIADFLQGGARLDGSATVDETMLAAALQRDPADRGLPAGSDRMRYRNGFWAWNAGPALGCRDSAWVPFLSGFGGIIVALFPNGTTYYYFSDGGAFAWRRAAQAAHQIEPLCR